MTQRVYYAEQSPGQLKKFTEFLAATRESAIGPELHCHGRQFLEPSEHRLQDGARFRGYQVRPQQG